MNPQPAHLYRISTRVTPSLEEAFSTLCETCWGSRPTYYWQAATGRNLGELYVARDPRQQQLNWELFQTTWREISKLGDEERGRSESLRGGKKAAGLPRLQVRKIRNEEWAESWKKHFKLIRIGKRLVVAPPWAKPKLSQTCQLVTLNPGLSFGTGQHPTTRFCLQVLTELEPAPQTRLLDLGTGSGILAIAAAKLGWKSIRGLDNDPLSIRVAKENARTNGVERQIQFDVADLSRLKPGPYRSQVVCANLIAELLILESERIAQMVSPGGHLILAGILADRYLRVAAVYQNLGFRPAKKFREGEWKSGSFIRDVD